MNVQARQREGLGRHGDLKKSGSSSYSLDHQEAFFAAVMEWAQRFAFLMLPIAALILSVLFVFKKNVYVFDHLIFSMHSLSFQGLLLTVVFLPGARSTGAAGCCWPRPSTCSCTCAEPTGSASSGP